MNTRPFLIALFATIACFGTQAQSNEAKKTQNQIVMHTPDGRDSLISNVTFVGPDSICLWQRQMLYREGDSLRVLLPEEVRNVKRNGKTFWSQPIETESGVVEQLLVQRTYNGGEEWPSFYRYYTAKGKTLDYVQVNGGVLKLIDPKDPDNAFRHELRQKNAAQGGNAQIDRRLSRMKPSRYAVREACILISKQNDNMIPRSRFGVGVGVFGNNTQLTLHEEHSSKALPSTSQMQLTATVWADLGSLYGVSLHPELTLQKMAAHADAPSPFSPEVAFNRTLIGMPLLVRYTGVQLRGAWLPLVEAGVQLNMTLRNECQMQYALYDSEGYVTGMNQVEYKSNAFTVNPLVGLGLEYRLTPRHSLFVNVRYLMDNKSKVESILDVKQGGWIASVSINL